MRLIPKPDKNEYPEYPELYVKLILADGSVLRHLADNVPQIKDAKNEVS